MSDDTQQFFEEGDEGVTINLEEIETASNEIIPKGTYNAVIEELEYKLSAASQSPMWSYVLLITEGDYQGRKLFGNLSFSSKALPYTKKTIQSLLPDLISANFNPKTIANNGDLIGLELRVKTKIGKNQEGESRTEVQTLLKAAQDNGFTV